MRSQSSLAVLPASLGSSAAIAATGCAASFALIGLTTACFRHRRRPSCAPLQFPLKSCGFSGAETARKRFLLWKMGFSDAAYCELHAPLNSAWSSHTFAPPCANACAVFRPCGLRFAPCPRGSSRFAASDARRLACGTPCFIGLTTACFAHCARPSCAPAVHAAGDD